MKSIFLFLIIFVAGIAHAQTVLKVITIDKMTQDPIGHSTVEVVAHSLLVKSTFSTRNGITYIAVSGQDSVTITCSHVAYGSEVRVLSPKELNRDTLKVTVYMRYSKTLEEFVVYPSGVPKPIFKSQRISVDDFEFLPDGRMLLLTYAKNKRRGTELFLYDGTDIQAEIPLEKDENGLELIKDFRGNPHVVTDKNVYGITAIDNQVAIGGLEKEYFMSYIAPIVDTSVSKYFFSNFNPVYPAFEYYTYDLLDSTYRKIANVEDELMMELYRSEYKWVDVRTKLWAKEKENETGIDAEIWVGASYFTQSIYYKELYAPLFKRNDTLFLFDHYKNLLFRYDDRGNQLDSLPIFYHLQAKKTGWKKQLIQDQTTGEVYIVYENTGQYKLQRIDLASGELKEVIPLHYKYPDKILIRSNSIYYTYHEFETAQKKYLYAERMPLTFPLVRVQSGDQLVKQTD